MFVELNWFLVKNYDFLTPKSLQPNVADILYFKLCILFDQIV